MVEAAVWPAGSRRSTTLRRQTISLRAWLQRAGHSSRNTEYQAVSRQPPQGPAHVVAVNAFELTHPSLRIAARECAFSASVFQLHTRSAPQANAWRISKQLAGRIDRAAAQALAAYQVPPISTPLVVFARIDKARLADRRARQRRRRTGCQRPARPCCNLPIDHGASKPSWYSCGARAVFRSVLSGSPMASRKVGLVAIVQRLDALTQAFGERPVFQLHPWLR